MTRPMNATGTGAAVAGGAALIIGRTFLGGALGRLGIAGAFGAIGLTAFAPAVLVGGTIAGVGYTVYQLGKNREQNKQAQEFGAELLAYLRRFQPTSPVPNDMTIITSPDRRITIIYDPELEN